MTELAVRPTARTATTASRPRRHSPDNAREDDALFARCAAGDRRARDQLIERWLPLARSVARRYERSEDSFDDLFQVACLALVKAIDRYDPAQGHAFSSFAVPTMVGELKRHFRDRSWAVRPPRALQELALNVEHAVSRLAAQLDRAPTVAELAEASGRRPVQEYFELLVADRAASTILQHVGDEANVRAIMAHPRHCGGSDAILVGDRPHPRAWGTFPRFLGHYVREEGVLDLPECVRHLTGTPAVRLGLTDRGLVLEGFAADVVLFDPAEVRDTATFEEPRQQAAGIEWVLVDGVPVIESGRRTDALPGRALRRGEMHPSTPGHSRVTVRETPDAS